MTAPPHLTSCAAILLVKNVVAAAAFYESKLGFTCLFFNGDIAFGTIKARS